jgi:hypothetical protein
MPLSPLFTATARRSWALAYARDLLAWVYQDFKDPSLCRWEFWRLLTGLSERQARGRAREEFERIMAHSRTWDILGVQRWLRETLEKQLAGLRTPRGPSLALCPRRLIACASGAGSPYLAWRPTLPADPGPESVAAYLLDEVLSDLDGVAVETIGRCGRCQRYFIRRRARRGEYCSARCRNQAAAERAQRGVRQPRRQPRRPRGETK